MRIEAVSGERPRQHSRGHRRSAAENDAQMRTSARSDAAAANSTGRWWGISCSGCRETRPRSNSIGTVEDEVVEQWMTDVVEGCRGVVERLLERQDERDMVGDAPHRPETPARHAQTWGPM